MKCFIFLFVLSGVLVADDDLLWMELQEGLAKQQDSSLPYYELGKSYYHLHLFDEAILEFQKALELEPSDSDAKLFLGLSYLNRHHSHEELLMSKELFEEILRDFPNYEDAKIGLARTQSELHDKNEELLWKTLEDELARQDNLEKIHKVMKESEENELLELAKRLREDQNHWGAIDVYLRLVSLDPKNAEYMFFLGREYINAGQECLGIEALNGSIALKSDYSDPYLWLGKIALRHERLCEAEDYFETVIGLNPEDVGGWTGLAVTESKLHNPCDAEELFLTALDLEPDNVDVVKPYADFLYNERRYTDAEGVFRYLNGLEEGFRPTIFDISSYTRPSVILRSGTAEEREKDIFSHRWVASLRYIFYDGGIVYPVDDCLRFSARVGNVSTRQRLLVSHRNQFDVRSVWGGVKAEWLFEPYWTMLAAANMEWISNNDNDVQLFATRRTLFEPTLVFKYAKDGDTLSFGEVSDSWIFRDFEKRRLKVFVRNAAVLTYQHDFGDWRYLGLDAAWIFYHDPVHNQEQDLSGWLQCGIPYFEDLMYARYQCIYRRFNHDISGYYSFRYELTHWLRIRLLKKWLSGAHVEAEYWHGWRTTKGRNPQQQLIVVPNIQAFPIVTVGNQIDQFYLTLGYMPTDCIDFSLVGNYYHDSFDYTIYGVKLILDWKF